jgi:LDH2 family malate/lactate/ureidoglycolate dehydrogenase
MSTIFTYQLLHNFSKNIFLKIGCNEADAETATKSLLSADLRGVDSHGVAGLAATYACGKQSVLMQSQI